MKHPLWLAFLVFPVVDLILVACAAPPSGPGQMCAHGQGEICVESIQIAASAPFGEPTAVTVTVWTAGDVLGLQIILPANDPDVHVTGQKEWILNTTGGQPVLVASSVLITRTSSFQLLAYAYDHRRGGGDIGYLDVLVTPSGIIANPLVAQTPRVSVPAARDTTRLPSMTALLPPSMTLDVDKGATTPVTTPSPALMKSQTLPINVELAISHPPRLGETAYLTVTVVSVFDAPNSEARIELPKGAVLLVGNVRWQGPLTANVPVQFSAAIKFVETGQKGIRAIAKSTTSETSSVSAVDGIVLDASETSGQFHDYRTPGPVEMLVPGQTAPVLIYPGTPPVPSGAPPTAMPKPPARGSTPDLPAQQRSETLPISPKLEIDHPPRLDETVSVTCTVTAMWDMPNASARIELPDSAVLVDGELAWQGALKADVPIRFSARIKFVREGTFLLIASARTHEAGGQGIGQGDSFRLFVSQSEGRFAVPAPASGSGPVPPPPPLTPPIQPPSPSTVITRER